jgi:hypothetical protein
MKVQRGDYRYTATLSLTSALDGSGWPGRFTAQERDPTPIVQEARCAPRLVLTGAENFAPTGIRTPDRPARREIHGL